eukprot:TRINITY_DN10231_c0_g1_i2.p2 TRINITY_DN10231_c0_g1~~TRINITY_DN10231_c0_g1_i2.p2  ORF type:complete len:357 (-),score=53.37 TRINITY_DN10231_c0_g1_i2:292-1362(-)
MMLMSNQLLRRHCFKMVRNAIGKGFHSIPVIDVEQLFKGNQVERTKVGKEIDTACRQVGFFYIKNHGVPGSVHHGVREHARDWFHLPENLKEEIQISKETHFRGYQKLGANVTRYDESYQRDWHEAIDLYKEEDPSKIKNSGLPFSPIHGENQWPHQSPEFVQVLKEYVEHMTTVGQTLMRGIALGLNLQENTFDNLIGKDTYWCMRIIHYPPLQSAHQTNVEQQKQGEIHRSIQLSCGEHTDYGCLTIVNQDEDVSALQVKNADGQWIDAEPIKGAFVCNIGDMMRIWTAGQYQPTPHRVLNLNSKKSRISVPFFYEPKYETVVAPFLASPQNEDFVPTRYGAHLEKKVLSNFEL